MPVILNIDTAVQSASVCLAVNGEPTAFRSNPSQKDGAGWLHTAIRELLQEKELPLSRLDAIAISAGPGSYTGLRVGMAAAKGLCYVLKIPLITLNTLQVMAAGVTKEATGLLCPMIDARRMEVFTALYDKNLEPVRDAHSLILEEGSFDEILDRGPVLFLGNGSEKFRPLVRHPNAAFSTSGHSAAQMCPLSLDQLNRGAVADLAYSEPFYTKDFHSVIK